MKHNLIWLAMLLTSTALLVRQNKPSQWIDLVQRWQPEESSSFYRFDLPGPDRLQVSLLKTEGGSHTRTWKIIIHQRDSHSLSAPLKLNKISYQFEQDLGQKAALTQRSFLGANDCLFSDPQPGMWVRPLGTTWRFLTYQGQIGSINGPTAANRGSTAGPSFDFEEGYFSWQPGQSQWQRCDREGDPE